MRAADALHRRWRVCTCGAADAAPPAATQAAAAPRPRLALCVPASTHTPVAAKRAALAPSPRARAPARPRNVSAASAAQCERPAGRPAAGFWLACAAADSSLPLARVHALQSARAAYTTRPSAAPTASGTSTVVSQACARAYASRAGPSMAAAPSGRRRHHRPAAYAQRSCAGSAALTAGPTPTPAPSKSARDGAFLPRSLQHLSLGTIF